MPNGPVAAQVSDSGLVKDLSHLAHTDILAGPATIASFASHDSGTLLPSVLKSIET